jgi:hypothetical protein
MGVFFADLENFAECASSDKFEKLKGGGGELGSWVLRGVVGVGDLDAKRARDVF